MNQNLVNDFYALASLIPPEQVSRYLHAQGWELIDRREGLLEEWTEPAAAGREFDSEIHLLPINDGYRDFKRRYVEFLTEVADYYGIDAHELSHRMRLGDADVLLFRLSHIEDLGDSVSIDEASGVLRVAHRMLAMSARYTASPGKEFTGRMRPEAREYIKNHVSLGHTRRGSFVFPILSGPRTGKGPEALFAHRVMENLAIGLHRVQDLIDDIYPAEPDEFTPLVVALAESLQPFAKVPGLRFVDISFRWAPGRGLPRRTPDRAVILGSSSIRKIGASGARVRDILQNRNGDHFTLMASRAPVDSPTSSSVPVLPPTENAEISGQIISLQIDDRRIQNWGTRYSIVIRSQSHDAVLDVQIPVNESDYQRASEARSRGVATTAAGVLSRTDDGLLLEGEVIFDGEWSK
ncbi:hypothetical protein ABZV60_21060 [Streptomyces sp. NPDC004787]|uniref:hypothetical protein n=1 Tax=Streptomyces sp. NPDC004787 TaxID=3154291 RepID=UPI0033ACA7A0